MDAILNIRVPQSLADRLAEHKRITLVPTSAFVRFAIESALGRPIVDVETVHKVKSLPLLVAPESPVEANGAE